MTSTGRFAGLSGIKTNIGGIYFLQGNYVVELQAHKFRKNRKGFDCYIVEGLIKESDNPERKPGTVASQVISLKPEILETAMGDVKQHVAALLGISNPDTYVPDDGRSVDDFWEQEVEATLLPEQPCKGVLIHLNVTEIPLKNSPGTFSKHVWGPMYEEKGAA